MTREYDLMNLATPMLRFSCKRNAFDEPEFDTGGYYAKCWVRDADDIWLYKSGSGLHEIEPISEYLVSQLAGQLFEQQWALPDDGVERRVVAHFNEMYFSALHVHVNGALHPGDTAAEDDHGIGDGLLRLYWSLTRITFSPSRPGIGGRRGEEPAAMWVQGQLADPAGFTVFSLIYARRRILSQPA